MLARSQHRYMLHRIPSHRRLARRLGSCVLVVDTLRAIDVHAVENTVARGNVWEFMSGTVDVVLVDELCAGTR